MGCNDGKDIEMILLDTFVELCQHFQMIGLLSFLMILPCGLEVVYGSSCSSHVLIAQKVEDQMVVGLARCVTPTKDG
jgi:hypothetical protein